jgi:DNA repair exonuclease SbcCD ATPase subunit
VESSIAAIERTCSTLITAFNTNVDQATTTFQTGTKTVLDNFIDENNKLTEQVESLNDLREQIKKATEDIQLLKDSLSQISKDLKESQDEQDETLNDILQKVTNLPSQVHEESLSVIQAISNSEKTLVDSVNITISKANEIIVSIKGLSSNLDGLNTLCQNINSSIISSTTNLTNVITGAKDDVTNKLTSEVGKLETVLNSLKANEQNYYNTITNQLEEQEKRLNSKFDVVRRQNMFFSIFIIVLLIVIIGIFYYKSGI